MKGFMIIFLVYIIALNVHYSVAMLRKKFFQRKLVGAYVYFGEIITIIFLLLFAVFFRNASWAMHIYFVASQVTALIAFAFFLRIKFNGARYYVSVDKLSAKTIDYVINNNLVREKYNKNKIIYCNIIKQKKERIE